MANLLPTQEKSSDKAQSYHDLKTKTRNAIRDNLNYIYIVLFQMSQTKKEKQENCSFITFQKESLKRSQ